jgi:hypothetical protein
VKTAPFLTLLLLPMLLLLGGCATAEQDADDAADNLAQGLEGGGHLYNEKVMKKQIGNDFQ